MNDTVVASNVTESFKELREHEESYQSLLLRLSDTVAEKEVVIDEFSIRRNRHHLLEMDQMLVVSAALRRKLVAAISLNTAIIEGSVTTLKQSEGKYEPSRTVTASGLTFTFYAYTEYSKALKVR
jgi:hypothetical protein